MLKSDLLKSNRNSKLWLYWADQRENVFFKNSDPNNVLVVSQALRKAKEQIPSSCKSDCTLWALFPTLFPEADNDKLPTGARHNLKLPFDRCSPINFHPVKIDPKFSQSDVTQNFTKIDHLVTLGFIWMRHLCGNYTYCNPLFIEYCNPLFIEYL